MSDDDFRIAFKGSPMNRAKLRGLKRNAAVVLGSVGTSEDLADESEERVLEALRVGLSGDES